MQTNVQRGTTKHSITERKSVLHFLQRENPGRPAERTARAHLQNRLVLKLGKTRKNMFLHSVVACAATLSENRVHAGLLAFYNLQPPTSEALDY